MLLGIYTLASVVIKLRCIIGKARSYRMNCKLNHIAKAALGSF